MPARAPTRVVIADDDPTVLKLIQRVIESIPAVEVVAAVGDARSAVEAVSLHDPHVVVLDVVMPGGGPYACREIMARESPPKVIALSAFDDEITRESMITAGAIAYLVKGRSVDELIDLIGQVAL